MSPAKTNSETPRKLSPLSIETGRYGIPPIPADERLCCFCNHGDVEDEFHFLFKCILYKSLPELCMLNDYCYLVNPDFPQMSYLERWNFISNTIDSNVLKLYGRFVAKAFKIRRQNLWLLYLIDMLSIIFIVDIVIVFIILIFIQFSCLYLDLWAFWPPLVIKINWGEPARAPH